MRSITFFLSFIPILAFILIAVNLIFAPHNPYQEKSSTFECGFHSFLGQNRTQFNISFFIFGLLFLAFDLELVIALPGLINIAGISAYGLSIMLIFFTILTIGFAFELGKKALSIDSRQYNNTLNSSLYNSNILGNIITSISIAIKEYIRKFNLINLIIGFILLRIITISLAFIVYLCIMPESNVLSIAYYIMVGMILYKLFIMPWGNNKMVNYIIAFIINCTTITLILFVILIFIEYSDTLCAIIPISAYLAFNDPFDTQIVFINDDSLPNKSGPNDSTDPGGPSDPKGPKGPNQRYSESWYRIKAKIEVFNENRAKERVAAGIFVRGWFGLEEVGEEKFNLRYNLDTNLGEEKIPTNIQQKALRDALTVHFASNSYSECEDNNNPELKNLIDRIKNKDIRPFNPNQSRTLTPELERDFRLGITYAEKFIASYVHAKKLDYKHEVPVVEYLDINVRSGR